MKRLRCIIINSVTAASALLFVLACAWWVRSYRVEDRFIYCKAQGDRYIRYSGETVPSCFHVYKLDTNIIGRPAPVPLQFESKPQSPGSSWDNSTAPDERDILWPRLRFMLIIRDDQGPAGAHSISRVSFWKAIWPHRYGTEWHERLLVMPFWMIALVSGSLPGYRLVRGYQLRKLSREGRCIICGYDLRATPQRCPECGHIPALS